MQHKVKALIDNDVLLKGSCYRLLPALVDALPGESHEYGVLGAAPFVIPKSLGRSTLVRDATGALAAFNEFITQSELLEPSPEEQVLAAELEAGAQARALNLDTGESQLAAILISRGVPYLVTGDKRAIRALEELVDALPALRAATGRLQCLEQCVWRLIGQRDDSAIREAICSEPIVDKALSICCSCSGQAPSREELCDRLAGYIDELRAVAARMLATA